MKWDLVSGIEKPVCKSWCPCHLAKPAWSVMGPLKKNRSEPESAAILGARIKRLGLPTDANLEIYVGVID